MAELVCVQVQLGTRKQNKVQHDSPKEERVLPNYIGDIGRNYQVEADKNRGILQRLPKYVRTS